MTAFAVRGYDVVELLGFGASAEVWLGRERATGEPVALKQLRARVDPLDLARLRREAAVLAAVSDPHVVRLRELHAAADGVVLVLDHAAGGSLAALLAVRGGLTAGEVVTIAVPLARALAAISQVGLVHGDISARNILFSGDGRPLLGDFGVAHVMGRRREVAEGKGSLVEPVAAAGSAPTPASDVYALAAVCLAALGTPGAGAADEEGATALVASLRTAISPDPAERPDAAQLATAVFEACPPAPIRFARRPARAGQPGHQVTHQVRPPTDEAPAADGEPQRRWRRATRRRRAAPTGRAAATSGLARTRGLAPTRRAAPTRGLAPTRGVARPGFGPALLVVPSGVLVLVVGLVWAGSSSGPKAAGVLERSAEPGPPAAAARDDAATPAAQASSAPATWTGVLRALDAARSRAFGTADAAALEGVYAPNSPALRRDRRLLARMVAAGARVRGLRLEIQSVQLSSVEAGRAVLTVLDVMPPYEVVTQDGRRVARHGGRPRSRWQVTLVRGDAGWRVYDVVRR